jgi:hypothetical protein
MEYNKSNKILIYFVFLLCLLFVCCKNNIKEKQNKLEEYFIDNKWNYPFDFNDTIFIDSTKSKNKYLQDAKLIKDYIKTFCLDTVIGKDVAVRVIECKKNTENGYNILECTVDFYRNGKIVNGKVCPIEGHGIVNKIFLIHREGFLFKMQNDSIYFIKNVGL